jgi:hypothetical protein
VSGLVHKAQSLWAQVGGGPSATRTTGRPWYFRLIWENNCSVEPQPCGFNIYPDNPIENTMLVTNATSQANAIKASALAALRKAFSSYPANIAVELAEGSKDTGDHRAIVLDGAGFANGKALCGVTTPLPGITFSNIFYEMSMEMAQYALPITMTTAQDVQNALHNMSLITAIGTGIGNTSAHEIGHQFFGLSNGMEDGSLNTYNGAAGCVAFGGPTAGWNYGFGQISWEPVTANAWENALKAGFHK